jgi:hypothetical protein
MSSISDKEARGVITHAPDNSAPVIPAEPSDGAISTTSPSPIPEVEDAEHDFHSGRMTKFTPTVTFDGYPDGKTKTSYVTDEEAEAPANYVKLLKKKGLAT